MRHSHLDVGGWKYDPAKRPVEVSEKIIVQKCPKKKLLLLSAGDLVEGQDPKDRFLVLETRQPDQIFLLVLDLHTNTKTRINICWSWLRHAKITDVGYTNNSG